MHRLILNPYRRIALIPCQFARHRLYIRPIGDEFTLHEQKQIPHVGQGRGGCILLGLREELLLSLLLLCQVARVIAVAHGLA